MSREAMKLALEAMERYQVKRQDFDRFADEIIALREALAEQPAQQQEPVAKHYVDGGHLVYPTAQRPWVGLTDEEIEEVWHRVEASDFRDVVQPFAKVIETALRSKNENSI
jgi:hypothetical protein